MHPTVLPVLRAEARGAAHPGPGPCACDAPGTVLADRPDGSVVRHGVGVAKAHAPDTDAAELAVRLAVAAHPSLTGVLLPPLRPVAVPRGGRLVSTWPYGTPVDPDAPWDAPWEAAAALLARLHTTPLTPLPGPLPPMRGPVKAARAVARLRAAGPHPGAAPILRAWATLPPWARGEAPLRHAAALCHGDLHLGQLVRHSYEDRPRHLNQPDRPDQPPHPSDHTGPTGPTDPAARGDWLLIDVDDLGTGDPAWDLARPAAWFACGLLAAEDWTRFLTAYQRTGGASALAGDPWPALDVPARALAVQTAALAVAKAVAAGRALDEVETAVVDACDRMATVPPQLERERAK